MEKFKRIGNSGWDSDSGAIAINPRMCNACINCQIDDDRNIYCEIKNKQESEPYENSKRYDCPDFKLEKDNPWSIMVMEEIKKHTK